MAIKLKRVYEPPSKEDGVRFLVERLWPRGIKKTDLKMDAWLKEVAPSTALRMWFAHDPAKWKYFQERYIAELEANPEALEPLVHAMRHGTITLLYSSKDGEHNNAICLKSYLENKFAKKKKAK